jgi:hypothetical protein
MKVRSSFRRHPEVLASSASLEGWMRQRCLLPILRGSQELAPQDDGLDCFTTSEERPYALPPQA